MSSKGGNKGGGENTPARNDAERLAERQSYSEEVMTEKSAIPSEKPDWASDIPDPKADSKDGDAK